jgi:hypothetical protein
VLKKTLLLFAFLCIVTEAREYKFYPAHPDYFTRLGINPLTDTLDDIESAYIEASRPERFTDEQMARLKEAYDILSNTSPAERFNTWHYENRREVMKLPNGKARLQKWLALGPIYPDFPFLQIYYGLEKITQEMFLQLNDSALPLFDRNERLTAYFLIDALPALLKQFSQTPLDGEDIKKLTGLNDWITTINGLFPDYDHRFWSKFVDFAKKHFIRDDSEEQEKSLSVVDIGTAIALYQFSMVGVGAFPQVSYDAITGLFLTANRIGSAWGWEKYRRLAENLRVILARMDERYPDVYMPLKKQIGSGVWCGLNYATNFFVGTNASEERKNGISKLKLR